MQDSICVRCDYVTDPSVIVDTSDTSGNRTGNPERPVLQKIYGASNEPEKSYSPSQFIGCDTKAVSRVPGPRHVA